MREDTETQHKYSGHGLPEETSLLPAVRTWKEPRKWSNVRMRYWRSEPRLIGVTSLQNDWLKMLLRDVASLSLDALKHIESLYPASFPVGEGGKRTWPKSVSAPVLIKTTDDMARSGLKRESTNWIARERGQAHAFDSIRAKLVSGYSPRLPFRGELPAGCSIRLNAGLHYENPIQVLGFWPEASETWIACGDLGTLVMKDMPKDAPKCQYAEAAHFGGRWYLRFVWAEEKGNRNV